MVPATLLLVQVAFGAPTLSGCSSVGGTQAPDGYDSFACNSVCAVTSIGGGDYRFKCDIGLGSANDGGAWMLSDYSGGSETFVGFGLATDGTLFCCYVDDASTEVEEVVLVGSDRADTLSFYHSGSGADLNETLASGCTMSGGDLADTMDGALAGDGCQLSGQGGADVMTGHGADDAFLGGLGADTIYGGSGNNYITGDAGADTVDGEAGADDILGNGDNDGLSGGPGQDQLWGGNGDDDVCTGNGSGDQANGGNLGGGGDTSPNDELWAPSVATSPTGSVVGANSLCGDSGAGFGAWAGTACGSAPCCTYSLTSKPVGCP